MTTKEQDREMKIFIIHNNETERLNYLIPQAEALAKAFQSTGESCVLELVGPEEREREKNLVPDTLANRLRRARDAARLYATAERGAPEPNGPLRKGTIATRKFLETILAYNRPITIEQDVLRGHAECWKRAAESDGPAIILESDAVFREDSIDKLIHLSAWLHSEALDRKPFYIDLAGGCDRHQILNAWCFEEKYGGRQVTIAGFDDSKIFHLPRLTNNTVCAYFISGNLARRLYSWYESCKPMVGVDWSIMLWGEVVNDRDDITCVHTEPHILVHGSVEGAYEPWIAEI